ncbi:protein kinase, partial [Trypanosoma theileri]
MEHEEGSKEDLQGITGASTGTDNNHAPGDSRVKKRSRKRDMESGSSLQGRLGPTVAETGKTGGSMVQLPEKHASHESVLNPLLYRDPHAGSSSAVDASDDGAPDVTLTEKSLEMKLDVVDSNDGVLCNDSEVRAEESVGVSEENATQVRPPSADFPLSKPSPYHEALLSSTIHTPRVALPVREEPKRLSISLRCWVLCPLVLILLLVAVLTLTVATVSSRDSSVGLFKSLQELVVSNMESSVGQSSFSKMMQMAQSTGSMYFSNNTFVNSSTDKLMPLENGMMSRLCALLRDMDPEKVVSAMSAVSLTRKEATMCCNSRIRPGLYVGTTSKNGFMSDLHFVDPLTLDYAIPLQRLPMLQKEMSVDTFAAIQRYDTVVKPWKESLQKGEVMNASQYWVTPSRPPTYLEYVYPFLESYEDGTTGVAYLAVSMLTDNMPSMQLYKANETGIRVMLVEPNATAERFLVFGNNWGQPLSNVTNVWKSTIRGEPIRFMYTDDVTDPVMREGLKHINLRDVMSVGQKVEKRFLYGGFDARITAKYVVTESGVELVLVVVTDRSYYLGPVLFHRDVTFIGEAIVLLLVTVICIIFVECCMVRPLRANRSKLKMALSGTSVTTTKHRSVALREVRELEDVCDTLRRRLDKI